MALTERELDELRYAKELLHSPSLAMRLADMLGRPLERSLRLLPRGAAEAIHDVTRRSLDRALGVALHTLRREPKRPAAERWHKLAAVASGAVGGSFGLPGLVLELPVTTVIMLRSIADIARSEGHDLGEPAVRLACLEVFALGGSSPDDDAAEAGYFAVRAALSKVVDDAVRHLAQYGMARQGAPALVRLVERIAARFGLVVQEKVAGEMVPVIGGVGGALINAMFLEHFQRAARGHFIVLRLESSHGQGAVREAWDSSV